MRELRIQGKVIVPGTAEGEVLWGGEPISFWGGYDPASGEIIDRRHPLTGEIAAGRILAIPHTRGSSTSTAILLESVRTGMAPAAVLVTRSDVFLALAAVVADVQYGRVLPVLHLSEEQFSRVQSARWARVEDGGRISMGFDP